MATFEFTQNIYCDNQVQYDYYLDQVSRSHLDFTIEPLPQELRIRVRGTFDSGDHVDLETLLSLL